MTGCANVIGITTGITTLNVPSRSLRGSSQTPSRYPFPQPYRFCFQLMFSQALTHSPLPAQPLRLVELAALAVVLDALTKSRAEARLRVGIPTEESLLSLGLKPSIVQVVAKNWPATVHWSAASSSIEAEPPAGAPAGGGEAGAGGGEAAGAVDKAGAGRGEAGAPACGAEAGSVEKAVGGEAGAGGGEDTISTAEAQLAAKRRRLDEAIPKSRDEHGECGDVTARHAGVSRGPESDAISKHLANIANLNSEARASAEERDRLRAELAAARWEAAALRELWATISSTEARARQATAEEDGVRLRAELAGARGEAAALRRST